MVSPSWWGDPEQAGTYAWWNRTALWLWPKGGALVTYTSPVVVAANDRGGQ